MSKYYEETRIKAIKNFDYIIKVLNSCETLEQIELVRLWGGSIITKSFKLEPYSGFKYENKIYFLKKTYLKGFIQKIEEKNLSLENAKK